MISNTDKVFPCPNCGGPGNVIREAPTPEDRKLKCLQCQYIYTALDSFNAQEAGAIPDGPPELQEEPANDPPSVPEIPNVEPRVQGRGPQASESSALKLPRTISYIVISKDRYAYDFCNKKNLKQTIFAWETAGKTYDVYELTPKKVTAKVDLQ